MDLLHAKKKKKKKDMWQYYTLLSWRNIII